MPTYNFKNKKTGKVKVMLMTIKERDEYEAAHPNEEQVPASPSIVAGVESARMKPDKTFREILKAVERKNPGSKINTFD